MNCPKCGAAQADNRVDCLQCGIFFAKYERVQTRKREQYQERVEKDNSLFWNVPHDSKSSRMARGLLLLFIVWLSWGLIFSPVDYWQGNAASRSFFHSINTPFHEFGHIMFRAFGRLMTSLGGSLGQLLMPLVCMFVFLWQTRDAFAVAVALWWAGENLLDMVSYIYDAQVLTIPLLGGNEGRSSPYGFHDWEFILTETGLINQSKTIATTVHIVGSLVMATAMLWMVLLLIRKRV